MKRREFFNSSALLAATGALALSHGIPTESPSRRAPDRLLRHRFGVNYVPSRSWYYCYNDWHPSDIARDLDRIAEIGADHVRVMVVWPWFQPNAAVVSAAHLDRLDELVGLSAQRGLDVLPTLFTGWLSGFRFDPPYLRDEPFFTSSRWAEVQDLYLEEVSRRMREHPNFLGYDVGNEINCCWQGPSPQGDAWMKRILERMDALCPGRVHVNGVDHQPWFSDQTFSARALAEQQSIVALHSWPYWTGAGKFGTPLGIPYTHLGAGMAALARSIAHDARKPMWMQEFGACSEEMPEGDVPRWLEATLSAAVDQGVSWYTWWASHDVDRRFEFHPFEYGLGLMTVDNRIKEQGRVFKRFAETYRGKPVSIPTTSLPPPPVKRNADATWRWLLDWMMVKGA
jgi:Cellulase (glycosyl hydrolase family 5)